MCMRQKLFIITGATASGKSNIALYLAKKMNNTEIISADSIAQEVLSHHLRYIG